MTTACRKVKSLQIFTEHLLYAQHQGVPGTQLSSLVLTGIPERVIAPHAFHSPHCPLAQYWVAVDLEWGKPGPQMDLRQTQGS